MATLLSAQGISRFAAGRPLFQNLTLGLSDDEKIGLIGPNGAGKSTLLKTLAGMEKADSGVVSSRRGLRVGYVPQEEAFSNGATVESVLRAAIAAEPIDEDERSMRIEVALAQAQFADRTHEANRLSGGWRKRLAIMANQITEPDLLFLDEPTNHLDLSGVEWLEELMQQSNLPFVVITHDRYFLENVTTRLIDLNAAYAEGYLSVNGSYSDYLEAREAYLIAQGRKQDSLESTAKTELAWLRRGARARSTKAKGRIEDVGELFAELDTVKKRNAEKQSMDGAFQGSGRRTKELIVGKDLSKTLGGRLLFENLEIVLSPGLKLGLVGLNGSGKTTLLRLLDKTLLSDTGLIKHADALTLVTFTQSREGLDRDATLKDFLAPSSDFVLYRGNQMHVTGYAKRFGFRENQIGAKIGTFSGGEQARTLIAHLMLQLPDVLILDEPTNDLDLASLEALEEGLESFTGALVLVSHDRFFLDKVCNQILVLGEGAPAYYADYNQWANRELSINAPTPKKLAAESKSQPITTNRLNTAERREIAGIEATILAAEKKVVQIEAQMGLPEVATDAGKLQELWNALPIAKSEVERLYARWEELETKRDS
jgi:ABC transport system ATP-binding/permease protein